MMNRFPTRLHRMIPMAVLAALLATLTACQSQDPPAARADPYKGPYPNVAAMDGLDIVVDTPIVTRGSEQAPMRVSVPVRYLDDRGRAVQYRFLFLDDRGAPVRPAMEWSYTVLNPRVQSFLEGQALSSKAVDWRLEIRKAR